MKRSLLLLTLVFCFLLTLSACKKDKTDDTAITESASQGSGNTNGGRHVCEYNAHIQIIAPTCETGGYTLRTCICGKVKEESHIEPLGHEWSGWKVSAEPTLVSVGVLTRSCTKGHEDTYHIPSLNKTDYAIEYINNQLDASCDVAIQVYYVYNNVLEGESVSFKFKADYLLPHTLSGVYVYSAEHHYKLCDVCKKHDAATGQAHSFKNNECSVCHYVIQNMLYSEEEYGLAVSYNANEENVTIPVVYTGSDVNHIGKTVTAIKSFGNNANVKSITIPSNIKYINDFAFEGCSSLEKVYYDGGWEGWCSINFGFKSNPMNYASEFYIRNTDNQYTCVTAIELPDNLSVISGYAFDGFKNITSITIPKSIISIGEDSKPAFSPDTIIGKVYYNADYPDWLKIIINNQNSNPMKFTNNFYMKNSDSEYYTPRQITVPGEIRTIGDYQFIGYNALTKLVLSSGLTEIGKYAFSGCLSLLEIDLSAGCDKIGSYAFSECQYLMKITLPKNVSCVGTSAFENCKTLSDVYYPGSATDWCKIKFESIASNPMHINANRSNSSAINLYFHLISGEYALIESHVLKISDEITTLNAFQFYGFSQPSGFILPENLESIGDEAFAYCKNLKTLLIPKSVKSIGKNAIKETGAQTEIYYAGNKEDFNDIDINVTNADLNTAKYYFFAENPSYIINECDYWGYTPDGSVAKWKWNDSQEEWYLN